MSQSFASDTEKMQQIVAIFGARAERVAHLRTNLSQQLDQLRRDSGADLELERLTGEIEQVMLPQLDRLYHFLHQSHQQTAQFVAQMQRLSPALSQLMDQLPRLQAITQRVAAYKEDDHAD
jgi:transposase